MIRLGLMTQPAKNLKNLLLANVLDLVCHVAVRLHQSFDLLHRAHTKENQRHTNRYRHQSPQLQPKDFPYWHR